MSAAEPGGAAAVVTRVAAAIAHLASPLSGSPNQTAR